MILGFTYYMYLHHIIVMRQPILYFLKGLIQLFIIHYRGLLDYQLNGLD